MILNKNIQKYVNDSADKLGISRQAATIAYRNYWLFMKDTIENLPDMSNINEEEFDKLKVNFNIPEIGKFTTNYKKICKANKFKKIVNERISNKKR